MSGQAGPEILDKTGVFRRVRARSFASVHGVSVVILWSVLDRCDQQSDVRNTPKAGVGQSAFYVRFSANSYRQPSLTQSPRRRERAVSAELQTRVLSQSRD
jgi:hypothetical protein